MSSDTPRMPASYDDDISREPANDLDTLSPEWGTFNLEIDLSSDAVAEAGIVAALPKLLREVAKKIETGGSVTGEIMDDNGTTIGEHWMEEL
jgi:hypothetical protein